MEFPPVGITVFFFFFNDKEIIWVLGGDGIVW